MPRPASVLRRALFIWGWGHITLGDRRGWLLVLLQPLAIAGLLFVAWQLIDSTRWLAVFVPLVLLLVFWVAQAVHAYRRALSAGGAPGGELQLALFLPLVLAVLTAFWLLGGRHGSAASTVEAYMEAWESNRPDLAVTLFAGAGGQLNDLADFWANEKNQLTVRLSDGLSIYGPTSGLDPHRPFSSLRVTQSGATAFSVEIVRSETFKSTLLGIVPTSGQRTVVVARLLSIVLVEEPVSGWIPTTVWRIEHAGSLDGG